MADSDLIEHGATIMPSVRNDPDEIEADQVTAKPRFRRDRRDDRRQLGFADARREG